MISVIIPTLNADARLGACLDALVTPALGGLVKEVIVVDQFTKTASGKIRKVDLNRMYKERTEQSNAK